MLPENKDQPTRETRSWIPMGAILLVIVLGLLPVVLHLPAPDEPIAPFMREITIYGAAVLAAAGCYFFSRRLGQKEKLEAVLLCLLLTLLTNYLHHWLVDISSYPWGPNLAAQREMHEAALMLKPEALPHSYRFLPNGFIRLLEQITGDFESARDSYRSFFGVLVFFALYSFARLFLRHGGALACLVCWAAISPVSFRYYAGQAADPVSHLSFLLAFIFLETEQFTWLLLTLLIGSLAKETVLAMVGYYLLFRWRERRYILKAVMLLATAILSYLAVRALVLGSTPAYAQVSGVDPRHVTENWQNYGQWVGSVFFTVGILIPFAVLGWRTAPATLRKLALFLFPVLFVSSLVFSWLREGRNYMPLCAVLIVIAIHHLSPERRHDVTGPPHP